MTRLEISVLLRDDPQKLVDNETRICFADGEGVACVRDGWAAGGPWVLLEFVAGRNAGRAAWMTDDGGGTFTYFADCTDDGFLFNGMSEDEQQASALHAIARGDGMVENLSVVPGGGLFPEWEGKIFTVADNQSEEAE